MNKAARFWLVGIVFAGLFVLAGWLAVAVVRGPV